MKLRTLIKRGDKSNTLPRIVLTGLTAPHSLFMAQFDPTSFTFKPSLSYLDLFSVSYLLYPSKPPVSYLLNPGLFSNTGGRADLPNWVSSNLNQCEVPLIGPNLLNRYRTSGRTFRQQKLRRACSMTHPKFSWSGIMNERVRDRVVGTFKPLPLPLFTVTLGNSR